MHYIITYDISADFDSLRKNIAKCCKDFGLFRIQYSVFWGNLSKAEIRKLTHRCQKIVGDKPIDLRFIAVCSKCFQKSYVMINNAAIHTHGIAKFCEKTIYSIIFHRDLGWDPRSVSSLDSSQHNKIQDQQNKDPIEQVFEQSSQNGVDQDVLIV